MSMSRTKSAAWTMVGVSILAATASTASAQVSPETPSTATVPVRDVTAPLAKAMRPIGGANMLRALPDGSLFINDVQRRQLLRFDATLQNVVVVADTALPLHGAAPRGTEGTRRSQKISAEVPICCALSAPPERPFGS